MKILKNSICLFLFFYCADKSKNKKITNFSFSNFKIFFNPFMKFNLFIFLFLFILISCASKENSTQASNLLLQNLLDKKNKSSTKNNLNIMSKIMEPKLLSDDSLELIPSSVSKKRRYVQYFKNKKYISQQWLITNVKASEKILVTYNIPSAAVTNWEFYKGASILSKNDDVRRKRFIGLSHELTKKNNISFIYKDNKNFLIKFKEKNDTGYSFISYTNQESIYSIRKCDHSIELCLED